MATKLDLADAQFNNIIGLIEAMGLTKKEWLKLKSDYPTISNLDESDIKEVDEYFGL